MVPMISSSNATPGADNIELCAASSILQVATTGVYSALLFGEFTETLNMCLWLNRIPITRTTEPLQVVRAGTTHDTSETLVSGFSLQYKMWCCVVSIFPKLFLVAVLWYYGVAFILMADNDADLILNAVAVTFVHEIDDLLFKVLVPKGIARVLEDLPELDWIESTNDEAKSSTACRLAVGFQTFFGQYLHAATIMGMTYAALVSVCAF
jgi:hypothetical protein